MPSNPDVSVVLPVHNTMPDLKDCMNSLVEQDIGNYSFEVVAVDDGSTDGSGELLDEYASRHPNVRVIHQENSGWPGQPRNVAIAASSGRYVFFMDADDSLGHESLRRQIRFADRHSCDVVVPTIVESGRPISSVWSESRVDADLFTVFRSLSPQKLFRRSFLDEHDLRFPEGVVPLEDGLLLARAYLLARRVSVLADYDHYHKNRRDSGENISLRGKEPAPYAESVTKIIDIVREYAPDQDTAERIVLDVYRRKALKFLLPERFQRYKQWRRKAWVSEIKNLADSRIPPERDALLPIDARLRSLAGRSGDVTVASALADALLSDGVPAKARSGSTLLTLPKTDIEIDVTDELTVIGELVSMQSASDRFRIHVDVGSRPVPIRHTAAELVATARGRNSGDLVVPLRVSTDGDTLLAHLELAPLTQPDACGWDLHVRLLLDGTPLPLRPAPLQPGHDRVRLPAPVQVGRRRVAPYVTGRGDLALTVGSPVTLRLVLPCRRLANAGVRRIRRNGSRLARRIRRFSGRL